MQIEKGDIKIQPTSGYDDVGNVFWWNKEIYRGIRPRYSEFYRELFSSSLADRLVEHGLIPTEITSYQLEGFDLILKHKKIETVSYANEWCFNMLKDAALMTCDLQLELMKHGYTLKDAHPWNTLFEGPKPWFVDAGSIVKYKKSEADFFILDFITTYIKALLFILADLNNVQKALMVNYLGIENVNLFKLLFMHMPLKHWWRIRRIHQKINKISITSSKKATQLLRDEILMIADASKYTHSSLTSSDPNVLENKSEWSRRMLEVDKVYTTLNPDSVLDIGGLDDGFYSRLAENNGAHVITTSTDELSLNKIYNRAKTDHLDILPLYMDITWPTLNYGPWGFLSAAQERIQADLVLLLGAMHRLTQYNLRTFDDIAKYIAKFTKKWALIEFIGEKDPEVKDWDRLQNSNYNIDKFNVSLSRYFNNVSIHSQTDENRWLILCSR